MTSALFYRTQIDCMLFYHRQVTKIVVEERSEHNESFPRTECSTQCTNMNTWQVRLNWLTVQLL
jgi:hypothetical protein